MSQVATAPPAVTYPEDDGNPMSENTLQFRWIVTLQGGLDDLFRDDPHVFVAGDLLWYPVEGNNLLRQAPDVMVAFGRPKGDRGSYRQWEEGGVAPQVVFEVLSPGNRPGEMARKFLFYERYGVEEYFLYDPDRNRLAGCVRSPDGVLADVPDMNGFVSPRLGTRFDMSGSELVVVRPDGHRFLTYLELTERAAREEQARKRAEQRLRVEKERADAEKERADAEKERADAEKERADAEKERADRVTAILRAAGLAPDGIGP